jgi:hypothetical protein
MAKQARMGLPLPPTAIEFRPEYLDFDRGIRVGNLQDNERITRILKLALEHRYQEPFVTERWGRGVFWQWIGYLPRSNLTAKPLSSAVSFGCSKFFLTVDTDDRLFKCGMQVERGYVKAPPDFPSCELRADWDWHRLIKQLKKGSQLERELKRLVIREGFGLHAGNWEEGIVEISGGSLPEVAKLRDILGDARPDRWAGFQLYYAFTEEEVRTTPGVDLVDSMLAVFGEVEPAMNLCMQVQLRPASVTSKPSST